jgi:Fe-S cluster biosynthesis and repair protein YggX
MAANPQDDRIEQFRKMAKANPDDDLAHFALGQALTDAARFAEAVIVLRHVVKLNAEYSRAYVLLGRAQAETGDDEGAVETWQTGHEAAQRRGDLMVSTELATLLRARGLEPAVSSRPIGIDEPTAEVDTREPGEGEVRDLRTGRVGRRMKFDPFGDEVGQFIFANVSEESWRDWMEMSIKVVNELRLDLGDPEAQRTWDVHMRDYLNLPASLFEQKAYD